MSSSADNAIITKAKAIYGHRLKSEDYEHMLEMDSVPEIAEYLKTRENYRPYLADVNEQTLHRGQLEEIIRKVLFGHTLKLVKFLKTKDARFYQLNMVRREIDIILSTLRAIISGDFDILLANYPTYFTAHASFDTEELTQSKTFDQLIEATEGTRYHPVLKQFETKKKEDIHYTDIEEKMDELYYDEVFKRIDELFTGKENKRLKEIFQTKIDLHNIIMIYRLKKFYKADRKTIMNALILKYSTIRQRTLEEMMALPDADLILTYLESSEHSLKSEDDEYIYIEYYAERMKYNLAKRYMYYSNDAPQVYSAFLILNEIERDNLFNLIEGVRYDLTNDEIKKMLIY